MNVRSIWQHFGLVLTSALSISLIFGCGCGDEAVQDGGPDGSVFVDAGPDAGDSGPMCKGVGKMCFENTDCCTPFICDQNSNLCKVSTVDAGDGGGTPCSKSGESCLTYADCCAGLGLACNTDGGTLGETCGTNNSQPTAKCQTDSNPCGGDGGLACCSGNCVSGSCVAWPVCGTSQPNGTCSTGAASCGSDTECCTGNTCDGGHCGETCGGLMAKCGGTLDICCHDTGEWCWNIGSQTAPNPVCLPLNQENQNLNPNAPCGPRGSAYQCDLTAYCSIAISGTDECAPAGLACKNVAGIGFGPGLPLATCQLPGEFDSCIVGGPPCQPIANSSATNLQCLPFNGGNLCLQPCVSTSDCVDVFNSCQAVGDGKACLTDGQNATCTAAFTSCNSAGNNDGFCQQITFSNGTNADVCIQGATDGGATGSCCNGNGNRQNGALCAYPNVCNGGICVQGCAANPPAGTAPDSGLLCDTVNGPQYCFFPGVAASGLTLGSCSPPCDALNLGDAGSCPAAAPGDPTQFCTPTLLFDQTDVSVADTTVGVCTASAAGPFVEPGGNCATLPCQEGSLCINQGTGTCRHLCGPVASLPDGGDNGCQSGEVCFALNGLGPNQDQATTKVGFCDKACDGGPCP